MTKTVEECIDASRVSRFNGMDMEWEKCDSIYYYLKYFSFIAGMVASWLAHLPRNSRGWELHSCLGPECAAFVCSPRVSRVSSGYSGFLAHSKGMSCRLIDFQIVCIV